MNCRINRRREWTARIILEQMYHLYSSFVTLTYDDTWVPLAHGDDGAPVQTLIPKHPWRLLKTLKHTTRFRYFLVGEYGDQSGRPHYHACIFGPDPLSLDRLLEKHWSYGFRSVSELNTRRAAYTAAYTVKKLTQWDDERLNGQAPEFSRMSLKPPIGFMALPQMAQAMMRNPYIARRISQGFDVPRTIRADGKKLPLDKTMLRHLRVMCGVHEKAADRTTDDTVEPIIDIDRARAIHEKARQKAKRGKGTI